MQWFRFRVATFLVALPLALCGAKLSAAAEIAVDLDAPAPCQIRLTGKIEADDLARLKRKLPPDWEGGKAGPTACLSLDGGDFVEGLRIAAFVADNFISTRIGKGARCTSACAWIFLAGRNAATGGVTEVSRVMHANSYVALHAPFVEQAKVREHLQASGALSNADAAAAEMVRYYGDAVAELAGHLLKLAQRRNSIDTGPLVPPSLLAEALVKTGNNHLVVETVGNVLRWSIDAAGIATPAPRSRGEIGELCRNAIAKARDAWDWAHLFEAKIDAYEALYDDKRHTLFAQVRLADMRTAACEVKIELDETQRLVESVQVTANLPRSRSAIGSLAPYDIYLGDTMSMPAYAMAPHGSLLAKLADQKADRRFEPGGMTTLTRPGWCASGGTRSDEKTICASAQLTAFDAIMARELSRRLAGAADEAKKALQVAQRQWLQRREACSAGAEEDASEQCLVRVYLERIHALQPTD